MMKFILGVVVGMALVLIIRTLREFFATPTEFDGPAQYEYEIQLLVVDSPISAHCLNKQWVLFFFKNTWLIIKKVIRYNKRTYNKIYNKWRNYYELWYK